MDTTNPLSALADVAANLFISLPDSPQGGKPFIDRAEAGSPAALLRAMRKRLNLTQREFGILLAPVGGSSISPSVICQLESALQTVPAPLVARAVAATTAAQKLGEYLCAQPASKASDAAGALKALGPGCIEELQPYLDASTGLAADEATLVREFLAIVTKRRHSTGGSRPGARGPYRKLAKVSAKSFPAPSTGSTAAGSNSGSPPSGATLAPGVLVASGSVDAHAHHHQGQNQQPLALQYQQQGGGSEAAGASSGGAVAEAGSGSNEGNGSGRSTPCSTPGSSRGSSRPRSPTSATGYESETKSPRLGMATPLSLHRDASNGSMRSEASSSIASSPAFTPGGTVLGLGTPTPGSASGVLASNGEASLEVLMALRRLQEENERLQQENERLRHGGQPAHPTDQEVAKLVEAPAELARADVSMSC